MALKPALPKGTRDILPGDMLRREYIIQNMKAVFKNYGFMPIETPAFENLSTLTGKYGEEGDRLIFKILNSGDYLKKADKAALTALDSPNLVSSIAEKALRYDLTVPLARFVVQHQNDLQFPFKRYQIQPVWRADRPQKGRFREFFQCDVDVIGSESLLIDLDLIQLYADVFMRLSLDVNIKINNRKILAGLAETLGIRERLIDFTVILDKLDKISLSGVLNELDANEFSQTVKNAVEQICNSRGNNNEQLKNIESLLKDSETGKKGVEELRFIIENTDDNLPLKIDLSLARGLDYYTGSIFEVVASGVELGSVGGGGRYDDLTSVFGKKGLSGIGISFGLDRIFLALEELKLFPSMQEEGTEILFINFGINEALHARKLAAELRKLNVNAEVYPDAVKLKKQLDFANKSNIKHVIIIGSEELKKETYILKNMESGTQSEVSRVELLATFNNKKSVKNAIH